MTFSRERSPLEFMISGGFVVSVAACAAVAALLPPGTPRVAAMALVVGAYAAWSRSLLAASATALMGWLFTTGFLVNGLGELSLTAPDLLRLGMFGGVALAGYGVALAGYGVAAVAGPARGDIGASLGHGLAIRVREYRAVPRT
ncbi:hypothetical protein ACWDLG_19765 [Nonomuraea sp. NPDC003727]